MRTYHWWKFDENPSLMETWWEPIIDRNLMRTYHWWKFNENPSLMKIWWEPIIWFTFTLFFFKMRIILFNLVFYVFSILKGLYSIQFSDFLFILILASISLSDEKLFNQCFQAINAFVQGYSESQVSLGFVTKIKALVQNP